MQWFRSNIKHGSRLAFLRLSCQFVLSFGHCHAVSASAALAVQSGTALSDLFYANGFRAPDAASESAQQPPASNPDSDQQQSDTCPICGVIVLANAVLCAAPPLLLLPQAAEFSYLTADAGSADLNSARVAFQP